MTSGASNLDDDARARQSAAKRLPPSRYSRTLLDETIALWQPYYPAPLTDEDAREIIDNVAGFFSLLMGARRLSRELGD